MVFLLGLVSVSRDWCLFWKVLVYGGWLSQLLLDDLN